MIYVKRLNSNGCLSKVEKGERIFADESTSPDKQISKREYHCLTCALRVFLDNIRADTLSSADWGIES